MKTVKLYKSFNGTYLSVSDKCENFGEEYIPAADVRALVKAAEEEIKWRNDTTYNSLKAALDRLEKLNGEFDTKNVELLETIARLDSEVEKLRAELNKPEKSSKADIKWFDSLG